MLAKSWIRSIFSAAFATPRKKSKTRPSFGPLQLLTLEDRITPATITVNTTADSVDPDPSLTSLREAITLANTIPGNDTIDFNLTGSSPFTITLQSALPNILDANAAIPGGTVGTLTINSLGASALTISGDNGKSDRDFNVFTIESGGDLTISGVTVSGAKTTSGGAFENSGTLAVSNSTLSGNNATFGGGISNHGTLTISNSTLSGNSGSIHGGGIYTSNPGNTTVSNSTLSGNFGLFGAGIYNRGTVTVSNSTLSGNYAGAGGGIVNDDSGTLTVTNSTLSGNSAKYGGGGIGNNPFGTLNIANTIIANSTGGDFVGAAPATNSNNLVEDGSITGGGSISGDPLLGPLQNNGGPTFTMALFTGSPAIGKTAGTGTDQRGINRTTSDIGAYSFGIQVTTTADTVDADPSVTSLREAITLANTTPGNDQISFAFSSGASPFTITLDSALPTIVSANTVVGAGTAGTLTITGLGMSSITISGDNGKSDRDFNIFNINSGGDLTISAVTVSGAKTTGSGGAFNNSGTLTVTNSTLSGNYAIDGGGIHNHSNGKLAVTNSTLSNNTAIGINGFIGGGGGAITNIEGNANISNSTISGNKSNFGGAINNVGIVTVSNSTISGNSANVVGGAINTTTGIFIVSNSTLSGNSSTNQGGGILNNDTLFIANTIIANSTTGGIAGGDYSGTGTIEVNTNNLVEDGSLPGTAEIVGDPLLGPLQNNGGPTFTMALLSGSPAIGAGDATISNNPPINGLDQRGFIRNTSDIGAYSFNFASANDVVVSLDNLNQVVLTLASTGTTLSDVHTAYNAGANTLTITAATVGTLLTAPAGGITGITIDNAATDNTITLDLNTLTNFAGLVIVGNSGVDAVTIGAGRVDLSVVSGGFAVTAGTINLNGNVTTTGSQTYAGAVTLGISSGILGAGSGDINFSGTVNSAPTFKNNLTLNTTGALNFSGAVGSDIGNLTITQSGGATFQSTVNADTVTISDTTGTIAFQGNLTLGTGLVTAAKGYNVSFTGAINTIAGATTFNNTGTVTLNDGKDSTLFAGGLVITAPSSINLQGTVATTNTTMTIGDVNTGITNNGTSGSPTILDAGTGSINIEGNVIGNGSNNPLEVITAGSGVTTLSGVNTAELQMSSGVVTIANTDDQSGGYRVSGGTLQGGSIAKVGYILAQTGTSQLAPGVGGPGMMHVNNALLLSSGNTVQIDLQGTTPETQYDQLVICDFSNVELNNTNLALSPTFTPTAGTVFTIIDNQSFPPIVGTFNGLAEGAVVVANGSTYQISYVGGTGNDVTLTVLPPAPLVIGCTSPNGNDPANPGTSANLYDPNTGLVQVIGVPFPGFMGEIRVAAGDFNNDGVAEIVAAAGPGGGPAVAILDSTTGVVLKAFFAYDPSFTGGVFVAVQDTNGDGVEDIVTGAGAGGGPHVKIFNGANLQELASFFAYTETFSGGVSVATADINGDDILDIVTGAGPGGGPHVKVFDGATQTVLSQWYAYPVDFTGGVFVGMGDLGNDGDFEVITGAGNGGGPVVAVFDPFTGTLQTQFLAYAQEFSGGVRVGASDGTGDGVTDLITGAGPGGGPHVKAFSYPDLDLLFEFFSGPVDNTEGVFVS